MALALLLTGWTRCALGAPPEAERVPTRPVRIRAVWPHDPKAFTQGLLWRGGKLYESVGLHGRSALREVELESGRVLRQADLPADEFGEGLAAVGDELVQLTWQEGVVHVWRTVDFAPLRSFAFRGEGWGLAWDGARLVQSDGSATLRMRSPRDFSEVGTLRVVRDGRPQAYLNELEFVEGRIYANVWQSDEIVRIDPTSGAVEVVFDASGLLTPDERRHADVLNGIAWNPERRVFYLTGKLWPKLFEVELPADPN